MQFIKLFFICAMMSAALNVNEMMANQPELPSVQQVDDTMDKKKTKNVGFFDKIKNLFFTTKTMPEAKTDFFQPVASDEGGVNQAQTDNNISGGNLQDVGGDAMDVNVGQEIASSGTNQTPIPADVESYGNEYTEQTTDGFGTQQNSNSDGNLQSGQQFVNDEGATNMPSQNINDNQTPDVSGAEQTSNAADLQTTSAVGDREQYMADVTTQNEDRSSGGVDMRDQTQAQSQVAVTTRESGDGMAAGVGVKVVTKGARSKENGSNTADVRDSMNGVASSSNSSTSNQSVNIQVADSSKNNARGDVGDGAKSDGQNDMNQSIEQSNDNPSVNVKVRVKRTQRNINQDIQSKVVNVLEQQVKENEIRAQQERDAAVSDEQIIQDIIASTTQGGMNNDGQQLDFVQSEMVYLLLHLEEADQEDSIKQEMFEEGVDFLAYAKNLEPQVLYLARFEKRKENQSFLRYSMQQMQNSSYELQRIGVRCD
ncbi:hypothetical protein [Candidatus Sarmatiella mevalonica]|uniref:hypothetical protein n=1 Tax=Candidatus Sarmatiella mevalonica TaxID=2770581 RepID=UPI00192089E2|nr:hypothetical protein [Candidatus Sarmatiella mevalonica]